VDPKIPVEEAVKTLAELVKEGKFDYIGLSECSAETLKRADAVCFCAGTHELRLRYAYLAVTGTSHCSSRNRSQPVVLRRGNEER